jgi:TPR repeat protein
VAHQNAAYILNSRLQLNEGELNFAQQDPLLAYKNNPSGLTSGLTEQQFLHTNWQAVDLSGHITSTAAMQPIHPPFSLRLQLVHSLAACSASAAPSSSTGSKFSSWSSSSSCALRLGHCFVEGPEYCGLEKDTTMAVWWYGKAAQQGDGLANIYLGVMNHFGIGTDSVWYYKY